MIQPTAQQLYPQQGGANAVSINIYNPQAYGAPAQQQAPQMPNYTNSLYQMPQASMYQPQADPMAAYYQQYMPMQNPIQPVMMPQQQYVPQYQPEFVAAPMPQVMPQSIMEQPQVEAAPIEAQVATEAAPEVATEAPVEAPAAPEVAVVPEAAQAVTVDTEALVNALKGTDSAQKEQAINKIAEHVQDSPEVALQVVSEPIMQALVDVINEDTTGLQGPTDEQIAVAQKVANGEELTPEEDALAEQLSPRDQANKNRIFALYTIAMIQKLQKEELAQYSEAQAANGQQPLEPLKVQDLIGYTDIVNVVKNDQRPEVKVAAIQALRFVADANDADAVKEVLADSLNSSDAAVKAAAEEAMTIINAAQAQ